MPNVNDLKRSKFLTQKAIEKPILVTISGYEEVNVAMEGAEPDEKWVLYFKELDKPLVLNSTNGQIIASIVGSGEFDDWIGHKIVLYVDPNISFGGKLVGGIRCKAPRIPGQQKPVSKPQTITEKAAMERAKNNQELMAEHEAAGIKENQLADELAEELAEEPQRDEDGIPY